MSRYWRGVYLDDRMADQMEEVARLSGDVYVRPTQGSYAGGGVAASAGTHDGGGAIDLAGQDAGMTQADREVIRDAGRQVGIAMWIRSPSQSDWPWHLHGISVQPGGKWDQGCVSSGAHGQVVDYYEGRNGLASGAADDGPRTWVGVTWETYQSSAPEREEDDMTPEQDQRLRAAEEHAAETRRMMGVLMGGLPPANDEEAHAAENLRNGRLTPGIAENSNETRRQGGVLLGVLDPAGAEQTIPDQLGAPSE